MLKVVEWLAIAIFVATGLLLLLVLMVRLQLLRNQRRRQKFLAIWQPILASSIDIASSDVPPLRRRDQLNFLLLWNHLHRSLLDEAKDHLNQIGRALRIDEVALRMLKHRNLRERLLAIMALGELREATAFDSLWHIAENGGALLSVAAARSLVMIDAAKAVPRLIPLLIKRDDWPASRVATMLQTAGADIISDQIAEAAITYARENDSETSTGSESPLLNRSARLIRYLGLAYNESALPAARAIAESSQDPEVLAACLRLLESSDDLPIVRRFLAHKDSCVRVQAASALGRIGEETDESLLVQLLSDKEWWVRYRAAQALAHLPSMSEPRLKAIGARQSDPFARDILTQVMAEAELT